MSSPRVSPDTSANPPDPTLVDREARQPTEAAAADDPEEVLSFWFGEVDDEGLAPQARVEHWWKKDEAFDAQIRERFGALHERIQAGAHPLWLRDARGRLATIIVLDQFSRNLFRNDPRMYAQDARALQIALEGIEAGMDREVQGDLRTFYYLPLMHSENLEHQEACVRLFESYRDEQHGVGRERAESGLAYAVMHRDIIARWGRFPHRNAILGRTSSPQELAFLEQPNSSF